MVYLISLILALNFPESAHDFNLSIVDIHIESNHVTVDIRFEKADLFTHIIQQTVDTAKPPTNKEIQSYIDSHTSLKINDHILQLKLDMTQIEEDHIHLSFGQLDMSSHVKTVHFFNNCLLEMFSDQINIVHIHQADREMRGFQMDKDRTTILIEL